MKSITAKDLTKIIILVAFLAGLAWFLGRISWVIQLLIISLLIVYVLFPLTELLENRYRFPHFPAVGVVFLFFLLVIIAIISLIIPVLQKETKDIIRDFPFYLKQFQFYLEEVSNYLTNIDLSPDLMNALLQLPSKLQPALEEFASYSISLVFSVVDIFFILFIVFYLLYDFRSVRQAILKLVPAVYTRYARDVLQIIDRNMGGYIRGNIVRCSVVGILTGVVLSILGMPYALLLGIIAGILNIVLYIGPYVAAIPAVILSFSSNTPSTLVTIIVYIAVQTIDGIILSPLLLGRAVRLKPITVIFSLLVGQQLAGVLGMILGVPLAGIIRSLLIYVEEERKKTGTI
ncbi:MAG: AI-2E family transporter [Firmicutes bacterium]|jgi:predicted PurR-regulated permease PerM|nr:AI-2E family transporter [Bacillota bacterium]